MTVNDRWLLPDGVEEVLPNEARSLEVLRRRLIDLFHARGYDLVMPPLMEFLESLLTGIGEDLDLATFKITDQLTGRLMGIRADLTPQVARIDAHYLRQEGPTRLCYIGPALRTRPDQFGGRRELLQAGAELFGCREPEADCEIVDTMVALLRASGVKQLHLDFGHVGIYRALVRQASLTQSEEAHLFDAMCRKSKPDVFDILSPFGPDTRQQFESLLELSGDASILSRARERLSDVSDEVQRALDNLATVIELVRHSVPDVPLYVGLAELRGYRYHTGVVFSAFVSGQGQAVAQGGRYDDIGEVFGRARGATGFSADLRQLAAYCEGDSNVYKLGVAAPWIEEPALTREVERLRSVGERVIYLLPGQAATDLAAQCDRELVKDSGRWTIRGLSGT